MKTVSRTEFMAYLNSNTFRSAAWETNESAGMQWIGPDGRVMAQATYVRGLAPRYERRRPVFCGAKVPRAGSLDGSGIGECGADVQHGTRCEEHS